MIGTSGLGQARARTTLDLSHADFNANFVQKGNAAGTTATVFVEQQLLLFQLTPVVSCLLFLGQGRLSLTTV
ncbi:MAG: hypothetical protein CM15mV57_640 [uncultured marine virus]|nr:MAG: hypothetical protein CM15mV57_640 [uncultured marine virus]